METDEVGLIFRAERRDYVGAGDQFALVDRLADRRLIGVRNSGAAAAVGAARRDGILIHGVVQDGGYQT